MPKILDECVKKVMKQGKSKSSAFAICTAALKKSGKLDDFVESLSELDEGTDEFNELLVYAGENALAVWVPPSERKDLPTSHFFNGNNKTLPYRNSDGTLALSGVLAAWKIANELKDEEVISKIKPYIDSCRETTHNKSDQINISNLAFPVTFPEGVDLSSKKPIDIQILKQGKWRHPWHGILNFDSQFFDTMIRNFNAGIPQDEISFDFNHEPDWGAACWVEKLFTDNDGKDLMATVELTKRGRTSIEDKEFKFFSSSYRDDYIEYAFEEGVDDKGNPVEREIKISHGPTLLGGGLTNRPFIRGMKPVSLSGDGSQIIELTEVTDSVNKKTDKEVDEQMKVKLSELQKEQTALLKRIKELEDKKGGATKEELEKVSKDLADLAEKITDVTVEKDQKKDLDDLSKELDDSKAQVKKLEKKLADKEKDEKERKELADKDKDQEKKLEAVRNENKELSSKVAGLTDVVTKLLDDKKVMAKEKFQINAKTTVRDLKEMGVFPATLEVIEPVLLSDAAEEIEVTLTEKDGDKDVKTKMNLADMFKKVFNSVPEEFRFSLDEDSESLITATGSLTTLGEKDIQKFADENKLSYEAALIELSKQGKI